MLLPASFSQCETTFCVSPWSVVLWVELGICVCLTRCDNGVSNATHITCVPRMHCEWMRFTCSVCVSYVQNVCSAYFWSYATLMTFMLGNIFRCVRLYLLFASATARLVKAHRPLRHHQQQQLQQQHPQEELRHSESVTKMSLMDAAANMSAEDCKRALERNAKYSELRLVVYTFIASVAYVAFVLILFVSVSGFDGWSWAVYPSPDQPETYQQACDCDHAIRVVANTANAACMCDSFVSYSFWNGHACQVSFSLLRRNCVCHHHDLPSSSRGRVQSFWGTPNDGHRHACHWSKLCSSGRMYPSSPCPCRVI